MREGRGQASGRVSAAAVSDGGYGNGLGGAGGRVERRRRGGIKEVEGRVDGAGWVGLASTMRAREAPSHRPPRRTRHRTACGGVGVWDDADARKG
jgi:hypothetical protein